MESNKNHLKTNKDQRQHEIQAANYLESSYQLLKNLIRELLDQNQGVGQSVFQKLTMPLQLINVLVVEVSMKQTSVILSSNSFSQMPFHPLANSSTLSISSTTHSANTSVVNQKILVDILILLWESYFSKNLVRS